jgi:ribosomal protein L37AE/L43A
MYIVPWVCPLCKNAAKGPITAVTAGDAGIWVCDACGVAYQITIEFSPVAVPRAVRRSPLDCLAESAVN